MEELSPARKFVNPEIVYGFGALRLVGQHAKSFEIERVLVVTDPGVMAAGWTGHVIDSLHDAGIDTAIFPKVSSNPRDFEVMNGADLYRREGCSAIVAVGGGSPIDCAKGIGIVIANRCHILECEGVDQVPLPMPPLICVPTTAGTSADVSQFAIINDTRNRVKIAIVSKSTVPDLALIDPETTTTMDPYLTACTGMDALVHAVEAYVSNASSPLTDLHALQAIRLISDHLMAAVAEPGNLPARDGMMLASLEAGLAFSNASLGAVHAMSHSLGGAFDLPHGECNALLLEHVVRFNFSSAERRYRQVAGALGLDVEHLAPDACLDSLTEKIRLLRTSVGISTRLRDTGVTRADLSHLAEKTLNDACMVTNPRRPTPTDIEELYAQAL